MSGVPPEISEVYKKWENKSALKFSSGSYTESTRQSNFQARRRPRSGYNNRGNRFDPPPINRRNREFQKRQDFRPFKSDAIASFKMVPTVEPAMSTRPFVGLCCTKCLPQSRAAIPNTYIHSLCVCNLFLLPFEEKSVIPAALRPLYYILSRNNKYAYPDVMEKVMQSEKVKSAIQKSIEDLEFDDTSDCDNHGIIESETISQRLKELTTNAVKMFQNLRASISPLFMRISSLALYRLLPGVFRCIHVHRGHIEMLKAISQEDCPIVYIPLHCSDLDYMLVSFILYMNNLKVPLVATDDQPSVGAYLRKVLKYFGAFFVEPKSRKKPSCSEDLVYQAVLYSYLIECLKVGHSLEITDVGNWLSTKKHLTSGLTILSTLIDAVLEDTIDDVYIVPVSMSYEKIADSNYVSEQLGRPKSHNGLILFWKSLFTYLCTVRVDFSQPFSLKEFLASNKFTSVPKESLAVMETPSSLSSDDESCSDSPYKGDASESNLRCAAKCLTDHVTYDAIVSTSLMSTHLLSFLFLTKHRQGGTQPQLVYSLNQIRDELIKKKRNISFIGESASVVKHAINLLGKDLIHTEEIELEWTTSDMENNNMKFLFHKPIVKLPHVIELQYYASFVVPSFLLDSIVVNALYAVLDDEICHFQLCESKLLVPRQELVDKATELCSLLQHEFLCIPPCTDLDSALNDAVDELLAKECLHISARSTTYASGHVQKILSRKSQLSFAPSDDDDDEGGNCSYATKQLLKVDLGKESIDQFEFLRCILSPYIESYWLAACTLLKLLDEIVEEREFIRRIQKMAEDRLGKGLLCFEESFGTRTLKNALKLFESKCIIEHHKEGDLKMLYLTESYDSEDKLNNVISWIEQFRK